MSERINGPELTEKLEAVAAVADAMREMLQPPTQHRISEAVARRMVIDGVSRKTAEGRHVELARALNGVWVAADDLFRASSWAVETLSECRALAARARAQTTDDFVL